MWTFTYVNACLWSSNDGKGTVVEPSVCVKDTGKVRIWRVEKLQTVLITFVGHDYWNCHENKIASLLNVLIVKCFFFHQNVDFSTYTDLSMVY